MKKIFLIALAVAVLFSLPLTAQAKVDFELGGYIRMDALWTSQQSTSYALRVTRCGITSSMATTAAS